MPRSANDLRPRRAGSPVQSTPSQPVKNSPSSMVRSSRAIRRKVAPCGKAPPKQAHPARSAVPETLPAEAGTFDHDDALKVGQALCIISVEQLRAFALLVEARVLPLDDGG